MSEAPLGRRWKVGSKEMANAAEKTMVDVEPREARGKNACRRLRADGKVPGNVYGMDAAPYAVAVSPRRIAEVLKLESGVNTILNLSLSGGKQSRAVLIRELQRDPVTENIVHVDFVRIDPTKKLHVAVPIHLIGTPEGVKNDGGILDFVHREVEVACLPANIPEHLELDVSGLHINQNVSVSDLTVGEDIELLDDPEAIIAVVSITKAEVAAAEEEEEAAEAEAEGAEPAAEGAEPAAQADARQDSSDA